MLVRLYCPGCGHTSAVAGERSTSECPICQRLWSGQAGDRLALTGFSVTTLDLITAPETDAPKEAATGPTLRNRETLVSPRPARPTLPPTVRTRSGRRSKGGFLWGLGVGAVTALTGCAVWAVLSASGLIPEGLPASWLSAAAAPASVVEDANDSTWSDLVTTEAEVKGAVLHLPAGAKEIATRTHHSGPVDITLVARTEKNNLQIHAFDTARLIFNWDGHPGELRLHRPDGLFGPESGSLTTATFTPPAADGWHTFRWQITTQGMTVWVDGRVAFTETRANDLSARRPVRVLSCDSPVDVQSLTVKRVE